MIYFAAGLQTSAEGAAEAAPAASSTRERAIHKSGSGSDKIIVTELLTLAPPGLFPPGGLEPG